jgi:hypothetical protein
MAQVLLLLGESLTDSSPSPKTVTVSGAVTSSNEWAQFGNSLKFNGGHLTITPTTDFQFGTGDFTVQCRMQFPGAAPANKYAWTIGTYGFTNGYNLNTDSGGGAGNFLLRVGRLDPNAATLISAAVPLATLNAAGGAHIEVTRASGTVRLFVNGTQVGSAASSLDVLPTRVRVGDMNNNSGADNMGVFTWIGFIDELRVDDTALHTADFTPPVSSHLPPLVTGFKPITFGIGSIPLLVSGFHPIAFGTPVSINYAVGFKPSNFGTPTLRPYAIGFMPVAFGEPLVPTVQGFMPVAFGEPLVMLAHGFVPAYFGTPTARELLRVQSFRPVRFGAPYAEPIFCPVKGFKPTRFGYPIGFKYIP